MELFKKLIHFLFLPKEKVYTPPRSTASKVRHLGVRVRVYCLESKKPKKNCETLVRVSNEIASILDSLTESEHLECFIAVYRAIEKYNSDCELCIRSGKKCVRVNHLTQDEATKKIEDLIKKYNCSRDVPKKYQAWFK